MDRKEESDGEVLKGFFNSDRVDRLHILYNAACAFKFTCLAYLWLSFTVTL